MEKSCERVIRAGLVILLVLVPLFFIYHNQQGIYFSIYEEAKEVLAQILILVLFCLWLLKMNSTGNFQCRKSPLNLPLIIFLSIIILSAFWAENPYQSWKFIKRWLAHIALYFIVLNNVSTMKQIRVFMAVMVSTAVLVALYGIAQYYGWEFSQLYQVITRNSTTGNPIFGGAFMACVLPLALSLVVYGIKRRPAWLVYYIPAVILWIYLIVAQGRGPWVGLTAAVLIMLAAGMGKKIYRLRLSVSIFSLILVSNLFLLVFVPRFDEIAARRVQRLKCASMPAKSSAASQEEASLQKKQISLPPLFKIKPGYAWWIKRLLTVFNSAYATNRQRIEIWKGTVRMIGAHPFLGVGIGNFSLIYPFYQTREGLLSYGQDHFIRQAHNEYLQFAAELGMVSLGVFIWFAVVLLKGFFRRIKIVESKTEAIIYLGLMGSILAILTTAAFGFDLQNETTALYFWFATAIIGRILSSQKPQEGI